MPTFFVRMLQVTLHLCSLHLFLNRLVMAFSFGSFHIPSCSSSPERTHSNPNEVKDVGCSSQAVDLASWPPRYPSYEWVDPRILHIRTYFNGLSTLDEFLYNVSMLISDCPSDVVAIDTCNYTDRVCHNRENDPQDFFFACTFLFNDLHVTLSFDEFTMESLGSSTLLLPSYIQIHGWPFRLICDVFRLRSSPQSFLFYYNSWLTHPVGWLSLSSCPNNILFCSLYFIL